MLKKDKNFRIDRQVKRVMATIADPVERHAYKNMMIQAQIDGSKAFEKKKKRRDETQAD
jgi:hypothetical protein